MDTLSTIWSGIETAFGFVTSPYAAHPVGYFVVIVLVLALAHVADLISAEISLNSGIDTALHKH